MRTALTLTIATLLSATATPTGRAEPITFMFSGEVFQVFDPSNLLDGNVTAGMPFSVLYTFESTTLDVDPQARLGRYTGAIVSVSGDIGGIPFHGPTSSSNTIVVVNGDVFAEPDSYLSVTQVAFLTENLPFSIFLDDFDAMAFVDDFLPVVPPDLILFEHADFAIGHEGIVAIAGPIVQLTPEPGTLALLVFVATALTLRRWRGQAVSPAVQEDRS